MQRAAPGADRCASAVAVAADLDVERDAHFGDTFAESKGRHRHLMERIPTFLITHEQPGLLGAAYCVLELAGA